MADASNDRREAYEKKMNAKRARVSSAHIGVSPETKRLEKLESDLLKESAKTKIRIGKERE